MGSIEEPSFSELNKDLDYDVLIIGAGLSGMYSLHRMHQLGLRTKVLEAGGDVGGTWYWNRYPGARFDSESYSYNFSFSQEILDEWNWSEHFASQPETLRYCEFVCKKLDLRRDMQFDTRITAAYFQDKTNSWLLRDERGRQYTSRFLVTCIGILNNYTMPNIPGVHDYEGEAYHTARWPSVPVSFENKRVAIIGTGATGIQATQEIVKTAGHLTVFQRTPNWSLPLRNAPISPEEMDEIRSQYPEIFRKCAESYSCFMHVSDTRNTLEVSPEERQAFWDDLYEKRGFEKWLGNFGNINTNKEANDLFSDFVANKIRQRVKDPRTAETLIPKCHGFGTKRVPLESGYFEAYNQPNVRLLDVKSNPIECISKNGIRTRDEDFEFDIIIYATGFDAVTGSFTAIDFQGVGGIKLKDRWVEGPRTFLGLFVEGFPNMTMVMGPHQMFGNIPRSVEYAVSWVSRFIEYCRDHHITFAETTHQGVLDWTEHVHNCAVGLLANDVDSWMTGVNKNLAHKQKRIIARYQGPAPGYRKRAEDVATRNYEDLIMK
jgi:cation diffusion facilitator CzcD-associated flavoprotein CzcO